MSMLYSATSHRGIFLVFLKAQPRILDCFSIGDLNSTTASVSRFSVETLKGVGRKLINILMMGKMTQSVPVVSPSQTKGCVFLHN